MSQAPASALEPVEPAPRPLPTTNNYKAWTLEDLRRGAGVDLLTRTNQSKKEQHLKPDGSARRSLNSFFLYREEVSRRRPLAVQRAED